MGIFPTVAGRACMKDSVTHLNLQNTGSLMGAWTWELGTNRVQWSRNLYTIFGLDPETMHGANLYDEFFKLIHPDDIETVKKVNAEVRTQREPLSLAFRIVLPDGNVRHIISEPDAMLDADGRVISLTGIIRDQTRENQIEQLLQNYKIALDQHSIVATTNKNGRITYVNAKACEVSGYDADELLGQTHRILNSQYHTKDFFRNMYETIHAGHIWGGEIRNRKKDGSFYWADTTIVPIKDASGNVSEFLAIRTDITARKAGQKLLLDASKRLAEAQRLSHTGSWEWEPAEGKVYWSDEMYRIFNVAHKDFDGSIEMAINVFHPDDRVLITELAERAITEQRPQPVDARVLLPDGRMRHVHGEAEAEFDEDGTLVRLQGTFQDVTVRREMELTLSKAQKLESLAVLAGGISHDFNNLLSGMFGYAELAKKMNADQRISHYLQRILEGLERSQSLTQRLMTFASGGEPRRSTGHLFPHVRDTVTFVLSGSNCRAHFDIAGDIYPCEYDPVQIAQVFDNLVRNAQQAMPDGGLIAITARNEKISGSAQTVLQSGHYVRVSVTDTGHGIPEENLGRLFDPFFSTKPEGHGLGLASSYSIVRRHGGLIEVFSTPGKGSVFHVLLPASPDAVVPDSGTTTPESHVPAEAGMILVMDDEDIVRDSLSGLLQSLGYGVVAVEDGKSALDFHARALVSGRPPVAIILDLTIPGSMGGKEVVAEIRKTDKTTPVFVSSGYSEGAIMSDPETFGFDAALPKPVRASELTALLNRFLSPG